MKTTTEYQREWREKYPQRNRDMQKRYFSTVKGKATILFSSAHVRAKKKGLKFQITKKWIARKLEAGVCEVTGLPFAFEIPAGMLRGPFSPSLDRINPNLGYTYRNTRVVVWIHNCAKGEWGMDELEQYAEAILQFRVLT